MDPVLQSPIQRTVRTAHLSVLIINTQLSYTTQQGAVLIIFPLNLQTSITAQTLSTGGEGALIH